MPSYIVPAQALTLIGDNLRDRSWGKRTNEVSLSVTYWEKRRSALIFRQWARNNHGAFSTLIPNEMQDERIGYSAMLTVFPATVDVDGVLGQFYREHEGC